MKVVPLVIWRYEIQSEAKMLPYETTLYLSLTKKQAIKFESIHKEFVRLQRVTYLNRLSTYPVKYYDYKQKKYYRSYDVKHKGLNVQQLDHIYADLVPVSSLVNPLKLRASDSFSPTHHQLSRDQTLFYPKICKLFFEETYYQVGLFSTADHFSADSLLYDPTFLTNYFFCASISHFISWLNRTYGLFLQPGQYTITHRRLLNFTS